PAFSGVPPAQTPHIDEFSRHCIVFDHAYGEALPTIPARYCLMTGQSALPFRGWGPLGPGELTLAQLLRSEGYVCGLITDCPHYWHAGMNYHAGFHSHRWVRGQEYEPWEAAPSKRSLEMY